MTWFDGFFASHAKKNKVRSHRGGSNKNGPRPYYKNGVPRVDPKDDRPYLKRREDKYSGGKGAKKRRTLVKNGVKTQHEFIDKRANTSDVPVYMKITHYRRDNPKSSDWREVGQPTYHVISEAVFLNEMSDEHRIAIENTGNFVKFEKDPSNPNTHYFLRILDGDRLEEECREYKLISDPTISRF